MLQRARFAWQEICRRSRRSVSDIVLARLDTMKLVTVMNCNRIAPAFAPLLLVALVTAASAQNAAHATLPPLPAPLGVPKPGPATDAPYAPQPILPGGVVVTLYPPGSPFLKMERVHEAEQYSMSQSAPGRISSIVNIHNPSIEVH